MKTDSPDKLSPSFRLLMGLDPSATPDKISILDAMQKLPEHFGSPEALWMFAEHPEHRIPGIKFFPKLWLFDEDIAIFGYTTTQFSNVFYGLLQKDPSQWVCIKIVDMETLDSNLPLQRQYRLQRWQREIDALQRYQNNPAWVRVREIRRMRHPLLQRDDREEYPFLIMEFCHGMPADHFNDAPLFRDIARQAPFIAAFGLTGLLALSSIHREGRVHRDFTLENAFVTRNGIWFFDTGIITDENQELTPRTHILGKPEAISPEQIKHEPLDHRSDFYALGCCLYALATGNYPFGDQLQKTTAAIFDGHLYSDVYEEPLSDMDPHLRTLILRLLVKDRTQRPRDHEEIASVLRPIVAGTELAGWLPLDVLRPRLFSPFDG